MYYLSIRVTYLLFIYYQLPLLLYESLSYLCIDLIEPLDTSYYCII